MDYESLNFFLMSLSDNGLNIFRALKDQYVTLNLTWKNFKEE